MLVISPIDSTLNYQALNKHVVSLIGTLSPPPIMLTIKTFRAISHFACNSRNLYMEIPVR